MAALKLLLLRLIAVISVSWPYWVGMEPVKSRFSNPAKYLVPDVGSVVGNFGHSSNAPAGKAGRCRYKFYFTCHVQMHQPWNMSSAYTYIYIYI